MKDGYLISIKRYYDKETKEKEWFSKERSPDGEEGYHLVPCVERCEDVMYTQMVENLDLTTVLKAINGIDK